MILDNEEANNRADLTQKVKRLRLRSQCQASSQNVPNRQTIGKVNGNFLFNEKLNTKFNFCFQKLFADSQSQVLPGRQLGGKIVREG